MADTDAEEQSTPKASRRRWRLKPRINKRWLVVLLLAAAAGCALFFGLKYRDVQNRLNNPTAAVQAETDAVVAKISKLYILPTGEKPTLFKVTDISKRKEPFFKNAQNGDQGLIYSKAQLVILYRPSENRIVNAAPLSTNPIKE